MPGKPRPGGLAFPLSGPALAMPKGQRETVGPAPVPETLSLPLLPEPFYPPQRPRRPWDSHLPFGVLTPP